MGFLVAFNVHYVNRYFQLTEALHSKSERRKLLDEKNEIESKTKSEKKVKSDKTEKTKNDEYTDSSTFLKGTNSNNPHNDYCQNFIDTGQVRRIPYEG